LFKRKRRDTNATCPWTPTRHQLTKGRGIKEDRAYIEGKVEGRWLKVDQVDQLKSAQVKVHLGHLKAPNSAISQGKVGIDSRHLHLPAALQAQLQVA
jgi:hypothetical protein